MEEINVETTSTTTDLFNDHIPLMRPLIDDQEWLSLKDVISSGWISQGPKVAEFEETIANFIGVKYAVATNSCTSAIHLALKIQGIQSGDEVILADYTCMADANAIIMAGATPVFADVDVDTFNITAKTVEKHITKNTKAILIIDQCGLSCDLDSFIKLARRYNLKLIDDAAVSIGSKYKGKYLGAHNIITTFSFHPRKMITTGEGGILLTNSLELAKKARKLRSTGASVSDLERHKAKGTIIQEYFDSGYNYRMTDIQATIGIVQSKKLLYIIEERQRQAKYYDRELGGITDLEIPHKPEYAEPCYSSYCLKIKRGSNKKLKDLIDYMSKKNISCRYGIQPLHKEPYFSKRKFNSQKYPVSVDLASRAFFIPIFPGLTETELNRVVNTLHDFFNEK